MKAFGFSNIALINRRYKGGGTPPPTGGGPTVNAGVDRSMTYPISSLTMTGSGTGTGVTYKWTKISGPYTYSIADNTDPATVIQNLTEGTYVFRLTATDSSNRTAFDDVQVVVNYGTITQPTGQVAALSYKRMTFFALSGEYDTWNIIEKVPTGYDPNGATVYPVMMYFPMLGGEGRDFNNFIFTGPQKFMSGKYQDGSTNPNIWNGKVTVDGTTYDPIIICIQPIAAWPEDKWLVGAFNHVLANYKVDTTRVYLMGASMGGWSCLRIASYDQTTSDKITSITTFSAVNPCNAPFTCLNKLTKGRYFLTWQQGEQPYTDIAVNNPQMVDAINAANPSETPAAAVGKMTTFGDLGHGYWDEYYDPTRTNYGTLEGQSINYYQWHLKQKFVGANSSLPYTLPFNLE